MKKIVIPTNLNIVNKIINYTDAFLFGIKGLSVNIPNSYTIEELLDLIKYLNDNNKEVFISLNKNMHNTDIEYLKNTMIKLDNLNIKGILYYDISIVNIKKENDLKTDLVWAQEHLTNNYFTCNYWLNKGINYTLLSSEITLNEILEIRNNTKSKLIIPIFGYQPMFNSRRHLVKNYLHSFNINDSSDVNYIEKENKIYPIIDDNNGTVSYNSNILEGLKESIILKNNNIDYILLNNFLIDDDKFITTLKIFSDVNEENYDQLSKKLYGMFNNINKGFLYDETIYRVKKDEKNN